MLWKPHIIQLTEQPAARSNKIDALFFAPISETCLTRWEDDRDCSLPSKMRSFLLQSNGLEAQCGIIWPVLPLEQWEYIHDECSSPHPWLRFGETEKYQYLLSLGHSPSIYRCELHGSDEEFFASSFCHYLEKVFRNEA
jgi:hypothetical protein